MRFREIGVGRLVRPLAVFGPAAEDECRNQRGPAAHGFRRLADRPVHVIGVETGAGAGEMHLSGIL